MKHLLAISALVVSASDVQAYDYGKPASRIAVCDYDSALAMMDTYRQTQSATELWKTQQLAYAYGTCFYYRNPYWTPVEELDVFVDYQGDALSLVRVTDGRGFGFTTTFEPIFLSTESE